MDNAANVEPAPAFSPVALPAKRGRGRPRKDGDSTPRTLGAPRASSRSLETEIGALLVTVNLPLTMFLPRDAFDEVEIPALAAAIDDQCKRSPRFKSYVLRALKVQSATSLLAVVAMIGARRAARHGVIPATMNPEMLDVALGGALSMMGNGKSAPPPMFTPPAFTPPVEPEPETPAQPEPSTIPVFTPPES